MFRDCFQHLSQIERKRIVTADNVVLRLNRGERPYPHNTDVMLAVNHAAIMAVLRVEQYPSYQAFYEKLATFINFPKDQIVVGAGIEEFIRTIVMLTCDPGDKMAVLWPTCAMYDIYAKAFGAVLVPIIHRPSERIDPIEFVHHLPANTKVVFLPNPGQPVETHFRYAQIRLIADILAKRDTLLVVDEAHYGFGADTAIDLVNRCDNIIVMRTFSKFFGAASIRVGYAVSCRAVTKVLDAVRPSGEITGVSMAVASVLMDNVRLLYDDAKETARVRDWLRDHINDFGYRAWGRVGFSILIEMPSSAFALRAAEGLASHGVYVKAGFPSPIDHCLLFSVGDAEMAMVFMDKFREVCGSWTNAIV